MSRCLTTVRRSAALLAGLTIAVGSALSGTAAASPAGPHAVTIDTGLETQPITVTTSTGVKLRLRVSASSDTFGPGNAFSGVVVDLRQSSAEDHVWSFSGLGSSTFAADPKAGTATVDTGSQLGSFGSLSLTASSAGTSTTRGCGSSKETSHPVTVTGNINFATKSTGAKKWGNVGNGTATFTFKHAALTSGSPSADEAPCGGGISACVPEAAISYVISTAGPFIVGESIGKHSSMFVTRTVSVGGDGGFTRTDLISAHTKKLTAEHTKKGESVMIASSGKTMTGTAVLRQAKKPKTTSCKKAKTTTARYTHATLTSHRLVVHEAVFGPLAIKSQKNDVDFQVTTKTKHKK